jgi:class 3 adenylate cyclase/tetratricopeptide (TPR) repeat protein
MTCPSCGADAPLGARFCPSCGQALTARTDERRVVTVLFGDLVGFTTLSEARDPEQVKNIVDRSFERLVADVTSFGGRVDKIIGDAIVALFGAPVAHEDDAERAVRAALQMQRTMAECAADEGLDVQLRVGVNTGEVLVGALRAGGDVTAMGDVVNIASRLQTSAQPGQVVVGPATYTATRNMLRYEPVGALTVKGRGEPVDAWVAVEAIAPPGHRPRRERTPLIGRDAELAMLRHALVMAADRRRAQLLLLVGDAGVGKSRLAEEVAGMAAIEHDALVLEGRCVPYGEANVWWPVAEAIRDACRIEPGDGVDVVEQKVRDAVADALALPEGDGELGRIGDGLLFTLGHEQTLAGIDPSRVGPEISRSLLIFLEGLARERAVVLVLSELHWADEQVLDLVPRLLDRLRALPFVFVATARPELAERWSPKPGRHNVVVFNLDPLDSASAERLLTALFGREPPPELRTMLLERSGGNPFFLEELVALLSEAGTLDRPLAGNAVQDLPATLRGIVAARLDTLATSERSLLEDAAVLGRHGELEAVTALASSRGVGDVAGDFERLVRKELLVLDDGEVSFKSDLVREVAYGTLTKAERARRHAALGVWLDGRTRDTERDDERLQQVAHHYGSAAELSADLGLVEGVPSDITTVALGALDRALTRAETRESWPACIRLADLALRVVDVSGRRSPTDAPTRWRFLIARGRARAGMHECNAARDDLDRVLTEADATGDRVTYAKALTVLGEVEQRDNALEASAATLERAVRLWDELGNRQARADARRLWGQTNIFLGNLDSAEAAVREALPDFRETGDRRGEAWALQNLAWIAFYLGDIERSEARLHEAMTAFAEIGDWGGASWAMGLLGWVRFWQGRLDEAERLAEQIRDEATQTNERWALGMMTLLLANVRLWRGHPGESVGLAREAIDIFTSINDIRFSVQAHIPLVRGLIFSGSVAEGMKILDEGVAALEHVPEAQMLAAIISGSVAVQVGDGERAIRDVTGGKYEQDVKDLTEPERLVTIGNGHLLSGRTAEALELLERAHNATSAGGPHSNVSSALSLARAAAGQPEAAIAVADEVTGDSTYLDRTIAGLGRAFALSQLGRVTESDEAFEQARAIVDGTEDRLNQGLARLARAHALDARGDATAGDELAAARNWLSTLGLTAGGWETAYLLAARGGVPG